MAHSGYMTDDEIAEWESHYSSGVTDSGGYTESANKHEYVHPELAKIARYNQQYGIKRIEVFTLNKERWCYSVGGKVTFGDGAEKIVGSIEREPTTGVLRINDENGRQFETIEGLPYRAWWC